MSSANTRSKVSGIEPAPYRWDFDGAWAPDQPYAVSLTFSVGVFQWIPAKQGGLKRGKVVKRISGYVSDPERVYKEARHYIEANLYEMPEQPA